MRRGMADRTRWSGGFYQVLHRVAVLSIAAGLLSACGGRTGLLVEDEPAPSKPEVECPGWPEDFFLTYAHDTRADAAPTAIDLYSSHRNGAFDAARKINLKEPFAGVVIDDFDDDGALEIHGWGLSRKTEYILDYSCVEQMWLERAIFDGDAPPRHDFSSYGDVNNDGFVDVVGWIPQKDRNGDPNVDAFEVYASLGGPGGKFRHEQSGLNLTDKFKWWLAATRHIRDMDSDGCADLIFIKYDHGGNAKSTVFLAKGDCAGHFASPNSILKMPFPGTGDDIGDLDGDGDMDLITGLDDDGDPGQTWIAKGDGLGALEEPAPVFDVVGEESGHDGAGFGSVFLYDWNRDGQLDALSGYTTGASFSGPRIDIRMGKGDLTFGEPKIVVPAPLALKQWFVGPASD